MLLAFQVWSLASALMAPQTDVVLRHVSMQVWIWKAVCSPAAFIAAGLQTAFHYSAKNCRHAHWALNVLTLDLDSYWWKHEGGGLKKIFFKSDLQRFERWTGVWPYLAVQDAASLLDCAQLPGGGWHWRILPARRVPPPWTLCCSHGEQSNKWTFAAVKKKKKPKNRRHSLGGRPQADFIS